LSVDPLLDLTGQAYAYTGDDPVNAVDPLGLTDCGWNPVCYVGSGIDKAKSAVNGAASAVNSWLNNYSNNLVCNEWGFGNGVLSGVLGCGPQSGKAGPSSSNQMSSNCPIAGAGLKSGSTSEEARAAAERDGYNIPPDYVAEPAIPGPGWVFRPPGSTGNQNTIRVMEQGADPRYTDGYVRTYNSEGQPEAIPGSGKTGSQSETHFPLSPDEGDLPLGE
jgi:hypothetical protein